jgi:hypothetical protein
MNDDIEAKLIELSNRFKASQGAAALADRSRLFAFLLGEAPEHSNAIRALSAALAGSQVWQPRERVSADLIREIAASVVATEGIESPIAELGVRAALRVAQPAIVLDRSADNAWVGETVVAGTAPPSSKAAPGTSAAASGAFAEIKQLVDRKDWYGLLRNRWVLGALLAFVAYSMFNGGSPDATTQEQPPQSQPPQSQPPRTQAPAGQAPRAQPPDASPVQGSPPPRPQQGQQGSGQGMPRLVNPQQGQPPPLNYRYLNGNHFVGFKIPVQNGLLLGIVSVSERGWDGGSVVNFAREAAAEPETVSNPEVAQLHMDQQGAVRLLKPKWRVDPIGINDVCVGFHQQGARDVTFKGSLMCVYGAECKQVLGCGQVP